MATERQSHELCLKMQRWYACISYGENKLYVASNRREKEKERVIENERARERGRNAKYKEMGEREMD